MIDFAHAHGMPVTSHELYPAVALGADGVEHGVIHTSTEVVAAEFAGDAIAVTLSNGGTTSDRVGFRGAAPSNKQ